MSINFATIHTRDQEKSIEFYRDVLKMHIAGDMRPGKPIVFMESEEAGLQIELIQDPDHAYSGSGISLGYKVADVDAARNEMKEAGLDPSDIISPAPGVRFFFIKDPDGVEIEVIE